MFLNCIRFERVCPLSSDASFSIFLTYAFFDYK